MLLSFRRSLARVLLVGSVIACTTGAVRLGAQTVPPASASRAFEVASVKPNESGEPNMRFRLEPGGRFIAQNVPAGDLIRFAYAVQPFQLEGGPSWLGSERFDVTAKAAGDIPPLPPGQIGPVQLMVQHLLAERFRLVVHSATKDAPVYTLVRARADGPLGKAIQASTTDCEALMRERMAGPTGGRGGPPTPPQPGGRRPCGISTGPGTIGVDTMTMASVAQFLSQMVGRLVVDKTGLTSPYSFTLEYTPDQLAPTGVVPPGGQLPPPNPDGPSLFTALQEQLGLRLQSERGPVDVLVIDRIEPPTAD